MCEKCPYKLTFVAFSILNKKHGETSQKESLMKHFINMDNKGHIYQCSLNFCHFNRKSCNQKCRRQKISPRFRSCSRSCEFVALTNRKMLRPLKSSGSHRNLHAITACALAGLAWKTSFLSIRNNIHGALHFSFCCWFEICNLIVSSYGFFF